MTPSARPWVEWAQRAAALAQNGLTYNQNPFDRERYESLRRIAAEMLAHVGDAPLEKIEGLLADQVGYATPKVDVRGAVFDQDRVLLVREAMDGRWSLPGGWADPGDTPREAVEREIREESGYLARAVRLAAVVDRARQGNEPPLPFAVYKIFFLCSLEGGEPRGSKETLDVGFFPVDALPPLSLGRVTPAQIERLYVHQGNPDLPTDFD